MTRLVTPPKMYSASHARAVKTEVLYSMVIVVITTAFARHSERSVTQVVTSAHAMRSTS